MSDYVYVYLIAKNKKMRKFKKSDRDSSFTYDNADYDINPKKIFLYKNKPSLLYFEGFPEPLGFEDIRVVSNDKTKKAIVELRAEDIHKFASRKILSVLAQAASDNTNLILMIVILIMSIASVITNFM